MSDGKWFVRRQENPAKAHGPFSAKRIRELLELGKLRPSDEFSTDQEQWQALSTHESAANLENAKKKKRVCPSCGKPMLPRESKCPTCLKDSNVRSAEESARLKEARIRIQLSAEESSNSPEAKPKGIRKPGQQPKRKRPGGPWSAQFDSGLTMAVRIIIAVMLMGSIGSVLILTSYDEGQLFMAFPPLIFLIFLISLCVGSFLSVRLGADAHGHRQITRTRRICFIPLSKEITAADVDRIETRYTQGRMPQLQLIFVMLLCAGVIPGLIFWFILLGKKDYYEVWARSGTGAILLYQAQNQEKMKEITDVFKDRLGIGLFGW